MPRRNKLSPTGEKPASDSDGASAISVPMRNDDQRSVFSYGDDDADVFAPAGSAIAEADELGSSLGNDGPELKTSLEDKFVESLDLAVEKRATTRVEALKYLCRSLQSNVMPSFIVSRVATLSDIVEKNLRKGKSEEQILAAHLAALVSMQLGVEFFRSGYKTLRDLILVMMLNDATSINVRAALATSIGICTFFGDEEPADMSRILAKLSQSFEAGYGKSDAAPAVITPEVARFYTKCLQAWSLLMTVAREDVYEKEYKQHGHRIRELLHSGDVNLRIAAGESLTLIQELMTEVDEDFELPCGEEVIGEMRKLATDSLRYRSKNDRRFQRSTFRQIVRYMEEGEAYEEKVKFGKQTLEIDSWQRKLQYDCFCSVLKSGVLVHLLENDILRTKFEMEHGTYDRTSELLSRQSSGASKSSAKRDSQLQQATVHKERQMKRVKDREKRSKVMMAEPDD